MPRFETRLTPEMVEAYTRSGDWGDRTFFDLLSERADDHPDREALCDRGGRITYGELRRRVDRVAAKLQELGVGRGDVVTIQLPNWIAFACVFFAVERVGGIANQINPDFRGAEVDYILRFSESAAYVCPGTFRGFDYLSMIAGLRGGLPDLRHVCAVEGAGGPGAVPLAGVIEGDEPVAPLRPAVTSADEIFRMAFTSGTTGNPKAVLHSHNTTLPTAVYQNEDLAIGENDVILIYLPLGLNWGYLALLQTLLASARAVLLDRFDARAALRLIAEERVTFVPTAPASIIAMLNEPDLESFDLSSVRIVMSGGASCPLETIRAFQAGMKGDFTELYGMLETGFHTYTRPSDDPALVSGTCGRPQRSLGLRLIDENGDDVPEGGEGEIAAIGPSVHLGYAKNPAANAGLFTADGWFRTGDIGAFDARGNLKIVGRNKEMINRGGKKFHPREIEEILYTHPKVLHAAIVGVDDARLGERSCLCVIPRPGEDAALEDFVALLQDRVATYKLPETMEVFDAFPFTPTGKIQRHELVRMIRERRAAGMGGTP